jgi:uncharacterized circularly permuted ATP-grasp superfamily protein
VGAPPETGYYDEVFDERGQPRPAYEAAVRFLRTFPPRFLGALPRRSRRLSRDLPITAMPRILLRSERDLLIRGTTQRARALRAFHADYMGAQRFRDTLIPGRAIDAILARTGEASFRTYTEGRARSELRAFYGPDVVRARDGRFYVLEDNIHFVGGPGDIEPARALHEALLPGFARAIGAADDPRSFLDEIVTRFLAVADPPIGPGPRDGAFVVLGTPPYADREDERLYEMLRARGAVIVEPGKKGRRIEVRGDGAYLVRKLRVRGTKMVYRQKIGFLWLNAEHADVDAHHPAIRAHALVSEAREHLGHRATGAREKQRIRKALGADPETGELDLDRLARAIERSNIEIEGSATTGSPFRGLLALVLSGKVQTSATPGVELLGDKLFYSFVPDLIRAYLGEEPILDNVPTRRFFEAFPDGSLATDRGMIDHVMQSRDRTVIKVVDGRGGEGVYLGRHTSDRKWRKLGERISRDPLRWIAQDYVHPSVLRDAEGGDARIVDIRPIAAIIDDEVVVAGTFWGRSSAIEGGSGKVNVNGGGMETAGYVVEDRG